MEQNTVQAIFTFKGENNDELCFKKGDIITITQREDGGWWEGTLDEKTGWFPSNYVKEHKGMFFAAAFGNIEFHCINNNKKLYTLAAPLPVTEIIRPPEEVQAYRSVVFNDLLESESAHVSEIHGLLENFLEPLAASEMYEDNFE